MNEVDSRHWIIGDGKGDILLAVIIKELRAYSRSRRARNIQIVYIGALSLMLFLVVVELSARSGLNAIGLDYGKIIFSTFIVVASLLLIALAVPISANLGIAEEKRDANFELLWLTPIKTPNIILGKLIATTLHAIFMLICTLPLLSLSIYMGGLSLSQIGRCYLLIFFTIITFSLIGILWSIVCKSESLAITLSYATICFLIFAPFFVMVSATVFDIDIQSVPVKITQIFSPLYAMLAALSIVNGLAIGLPIWILTLVLYSLISAVVFSIISTSKNHS